MNSFLYPIAITPNIVFYLLCDATQSASAIPFPESVSTVGWRIAYYRILQELLKILVNPLIGPVV